MTQINTLVLYCSTIQKMNATDNWPLSGRRDSLVEILEKKVTDKLLFEPTECQWVFSDTKDSFSLQIALNFTSENSTVNQGNIQFMQLLVSSPLLKNNGVIKWNSVKPSRAFERAHFDILKILNELGRFPLERKIRVWISGNFQLQMKQQFPATYLQISKKLLPGIPVPFD